MTTRTNKSNVTRRSVGTLRVRSGVKAGQEATPLLARRVTN